MGGTRGFWNFEFVLRRRYIASCLWHGIDSGRLRFLAQLTAGVATEAPRIRSQLRLSLDEYLVAAL